MSAYNDYMVKVSTYFVALADHYCKLLSQGVDDCCVKMKLNILAMYLDTIPRVSNENCLTNAQLAAISNHINELTGYSGWGTLTNTNVITPPTSIVVSSSSAVLPVAWNITIGTAPTIVTFDHTLGVGGTSWAMTYIATTSGGDSVFVKSITNRTSSGFTVDAYEDNVNFEGSATLIV